LLFITICRRRRIAGCSYTYSKEVKQKGKKEEPGSRSILEERNNKEE
jgi:hypothetical protein